MNSSAGTMKAPTFRSQAVRESSGELGLAKGEHQLPPMLILASTYFLNFSGLKQITVGLRPDAKFAVKIVFSHLKVPSRHVELSVEDFEELCKHFDLFRQVFETTETGAKTLEFKNFDVLLESMFEKPTVTLLDKNSGAKFSFQAGIFDALVWQESNVRTAMQTCRWLGSQLRTLDLGKVTDQSDPLIRQAVSELKTYGCLK